MSRSLLWRLAGSSGVNLAMQGFSLVVALLIGLVLARALGTIGVGRYAFGFAVAQVLGIVSTLGLQILLLREVPVAVERGRWGRVRGLVAQGEQVTVICALGLGGLAAGWGLWRADRETAWVLALAVPLLVGSTGLSVRSAALGGLRHVVLAQIPVMIARPALFLLLLVGLGVTAAHQAMGLHALAVLLAWGLGGLLWVRVRPVEIRQATPELDLRAWMLVAGPLLLISGLSVLNQQLDLLMLKALATDAETGVYAVASQLARVTSLVLAVVNGIIAPHLAALHVRGDREGLQALVTSSAAGVTLATLPGAALLVLLGPKVLGLYGADFVGGQGALAVLVLAHVVNALTGSVGNVLMMTGHERQVGLASAGAVVLNGALNLILVPYLGMLGAAVASAASLVAWNLVLAWRVRTLLGVDSTAWGWVKAWLGRRSLG